MKLSTIYGKSGKGAQVLTGKTKALPANSMRVLSQVDGKSSAKAILAALENFTEKELTQILTQLLDGGYIRVIADDAMKDFFPESGIASTIDVVEISAEEFLKTEATAHGLHSDVKMRQQKEAEARAKAHAEEQLRLEAAARAQEESERKLLEAADLFARSGDEINIEALEEQKVRDKSGAEERAKHEAKAREEAVAKAKAEAEAHERAERKAREEAEARAKHEAEAKAKRKAQEEAEARAKREAEEKARSAAEQKTREEAVIKAIAKAEYEVEAEAQEKGEALAKQEVEEKAHISADEKAREETERTARKQAEADEKARKREEREPIDFNKWLRKALAIGRKLLISVSITTLVVLFLLQLVNLSMLISPLVGPIEKLVSANINEPVTIKKVYASLWPKPHLVLDDVTVGSLADIKIATVRVLPVLSTVFDDVKTLRYIELSGLTIGQDNLHRPQQWVSASNKQGKLKFDQIFLEKTSIALHSIELPPFDGDIKLTPNGKLQSATLTTSDRNAVIQITPKGETYAIDMVADDWQSPIGAPVVFDELRAIGVIDNNQMTFSQIKGRLYGGNLKASMAVDWTNLWTANGTFKLSEVELEEMMPNFTKEASLKGPLTSNATFTLEANEFATILDTPEINADFSIDDGVINGIDLVRAMRASNKNNAISGSTRFNKFSGKLLLKAGQYQYKQLALKAGKLEAYGEARILANQNLSGEINVNLAMQSRQLRSRLNLSGKLGSPTLK